MNTLAGRLPAAADILPAPGQDPHRPAVPAALAGVAGGALVRADPGHRGPELHPLPADRPAPADRAGQLPGGAEGRVLLAGPAQHLRLHRPVPPGQLPHRAVHRLAARPGRPPEGAVALDHLRALGAAGDRHPGAGQVHLLPQRPGEHRARAVRPPGTALAGQPPADHPGLGAADGLAVRHGHGRLPGGAAERARPVLRGGADRRPVPLRAVLPHHPARSSRRPSSSAW